jgi:non-specific serine/threonine protein kinase
MIGTLINERYRLDSELGRGGMGTIYRGHDTLLDRDVAVKVLSDTILNAESRARLLREAQAAAQLNHPNIVSVHDAGEAEPGVSYIVMELVEGEALQVGQSLEQTLSIAEQVCAALEHAHAHGIIHRDLKPENILIAPDGTAKLTDFGLARTAASRLTVEGAILGTVFYLAPEQALGGEINHRVDLYALGVVLYEMTTGQLPFTGDDLLAVISQHLQAPVVPPRTRNAEIPPALDALIVQLLSKQPEDRPASAAEVRQSLEDLSRHGDLPAAYPARSSRISGLCPNNLPAQTTPFIGRGEQLAAVREELIRPEVRLLTLTGTGGTGKTRLALQVAADLLDCFEDGVFFVGLASVSDPSLVMPTIAQTLGVREAESGPIGPASRSNPEEQDGPLLKALARYLRDKHMLLVLDNFEQVTPAAPVVGDLLATAPRLKVLVTSRASLRVYGEHDYPVPPLVTPDLEELPGLEQLAQVEAVQLFVERAQAVKPDFAITGENGPAIAEICQELDGLPLAIELAAARVRLLPPDMMLAQLGDRLKLLTGGARDLPARHQTLRGAIDWSYDLLDEGERTLFRRLAVFCCTCTLEAVEAVCNPAGDLDVLNVLEALVDQSLLNPSEENGAPRFGMLETIREYALEQLNASGGVEAEEVHRRHATFFLAMAEEAEPKLAGPEQLAWLKRLETEHDNLRTALSWALERDGPDAVLGLRLAVALERFWSMRGYWTEGHRWLENALEKSGNAPAPLRARLLWALGYRQEHPERAAALLGESLAIYRELEDKQGIARALSGLGNVALVQNDFEEAAAHYERSLALFRELGDKSGVSRSLYLMGNLAWYQGDDREATTLHEKSLALAREIGNSNDVASRLRALGNVTLAQRDYVRTGALFEEGLALARELGDKHGIAALLNSLGEMARFQGDYDRAATYYEESLTLFRELGSRLQIAMILHNRAYVALRQGDGRQAAVSFGESLVLYQNLERKGGVIECLIGMACVAATTVDGQPATSERAARLFGATDALFDTIGGGLAAADQAEHDRYLALAREQLDEAAFASAWAEGCAMTMEQAVDYALGEVVK